MWNYLKRLLFGNTKKDKKIINDYDFLINNDRNRPKPFEKIYTFGDYYYWIDVNGSFYSFGNTSDNDVNKWKYVVPITEELAEELAQQLLNIK
jgi:hypothetical protein